MGMFDSDNLKTQEGRITPPEPKPLPQVICQLCGSEIDAEYEDGYLYADLIHCEECFDRVIKTVIIPDAQYDAHQALTEYLESGEYDEFED